MAKAKSKKAKAHVRGAGSKRPTELTADELQKAGGGRLGGSHAPTLPAAVPHEGDYDLPRSPRR
jgi:hypothetical protein